MRYHLILFVALSVMMLFAACKKDKDGEEIVDNTCTETREFWIDGTLGEGEVVTSTPCGNLKLEQVNVSQTKHETYPNLFIFNSTQRVLDTLGNNHGQLSVSIWGDVPDSLMDIYISGSDTSYSISTNNICNFMKLGNHHVFYHEAQQNQANGYVMEYIDRLGNIWSVVPTPITDSSFLVTSIDGIVAQNPFSGAYLPYCTSRFEFDVLMKKQGGTDTLRLVGTGRLGFR